MLPEGRVQAVVKRGRRSWLRQNHQAVTPTRTIRATPPVIYHLAAAITAKSFDPAQPRLPVRLIKGDRESLKYLRNGFESCRASAEGSRCVSTYATTRRS